MRFPDAGGTKVIYFDNAATTLQKPETVAKAVAEAISNLGNAGRGAYDAALHSMRMAYETREMINEFFTEMDRNRLHFCRMPQRH